MTEFRSKLSWKIPKLESTTVIPYWKTTHFAMWCLSGGASLSNFSMVHRGWLSSFSAIPEIRETTADIEIIVNGRHLTRVEEDESHSVRDTLRAPVYLLARWLLEGWWRLRWEPSTVHDVAPTTDWRMTHEMTSVGGGFVWPPLSISSTADFISFSTMPQANSERVAFSPIRYLTSVSEELIDGPAFESGVDQFVASVLQRLNSRSLRKTELHELSNIVLEERTNPRKGRVRRLEALLGYDPDIAPLEDLKLLERQSARVGENAVEELAPVASTQRAKQCSVADVFQSLDKAASEATEVGAVPAGSDMRAMYSAVLDDGAKPWRRGFAAAAIARQCWSLKANPLSSHEFAERLGTRDDFLSRAPTVPTRNVALAIRSRNDGLRVAFRSEVTRGRRFELARLIGDHVFFPTEDLWRTVTAMKTARQQFQRAFAAEFLCPSAALTERFGPRGPEDQSEIEDVAEQFEVDTAVVLRQLENRRRIEDVYAIVS